jgi:hypothetical protein
MMRPHLTAQAEAEKTGKPAVETQELAAIRPVKGVSINV